MNSLPQHKLWKKYKSFETWNVRNLCMAHSFKMVARELAKYNLDVVRVQNMDGTGTA
jgi:hypothetical protein